MATFHFRAVTPDGQVRTGALAGETDKAIARELRKQGLIPVYVGLEDRKSLQFKMPSIGGGRRRDVLFFTQELSTLLNAGVPIDRALTITSELTTRTEFRAIVLDILRLIKGGKSLAESLGTHARYFSNLYVNIVRAGEASGALGSVFERLSEFERSRDELKSYIISSMIYPSLLMLVGLSSILVLMNFVVPRFAQVFQESQMQMPLPTKMMLEASRLMQTYGWYAIGGAIAAIIAGRYYVGTAAGRMWWDSSRLRLPMLGSALRKAETSRFARAMETLVVNNVPLVQSIGIAGATLTNRRIALALDAVALGVKRGEGIAGPLRKTGEFPALAGHLLSVGEETGRLDQMFARMAEIYENDTRASIKRFTSLFEPLVILVMGVLIGVLILSMLLAITSINEMAV